MIRRIRRKFIWIALCCVAIVNVLLVGMMCMISYTRMNKNADRVLNVLLETDGVLPPDIGQRPDADFFSPETPYEMRFFTVCLDEEANVVYSNTSKIAAITKSTAETYAKQLYGEEQTEGRYGNYRFQSKVTPKGTLYIFLDCTRDINFFRVILHGGIWLSLAILLLVFILLQAVSKRVITPMEESYQKQKYFITNASHDIKTPLTIIQAETELVEMEHGESEWTQEIKRQIARLRALTEKLVFLSKMEESTKLVMEEFDVSSALRETVRPYEDLSNAKGLQMQITIQPNVLYKGNEEMLCRAFSLLLDNAVKYTTPGGKIAVTLKKQGKTTEIIICNDTDTIPQGALPHLFDRFYRVENSRNSQKGGNGIGLSVVKAIVAAHKGKVSAYSEDGKSLQIKLSL